MAVTSSSLDYWRKYFRSTNSDIFIMIDHAIMVAASDCPEEFRLRRDGIAERLFSCRLTRCLGCDREELAVSGDGDEDNRGCKSGLGGSKESKVDSCSRDDDDLVGEMNINLASNFSYGEAEALTDEIEEESQNIAEILRIKDVLRNWKEESESVLFESLRRLQLMALTVDTLKGTEIGKAVYSLRKHASKEICHLTRTLIDDWKVMVDQWVRATESSKIVEGTPDSVNPSVVDEEDGLPSPPLDEAFFATAPPISMELSQFFDGIDDDGNPRNSGKFNSNRENGRKPTVGNQNLMRQKQQTVLAKDHNKGPQLKNQEPIAKLNKPSNTNSGPGRSEKLSTQQKLGNEMKSQQKSDKLTVQGRPVTSQQDKFKYSNEVSAQEKLEATKRKLQESYQQAENAKKQRKIQVMELHNLPKQGLGHRNPHVKPGGYNRQFAHGRR